MSVSKVTGASGGSNVNAQSDLRASAKPKVAFAEVLKGEAKAEDRLGRQGLERGQDAADEALRPRSDVDEGPVGARVDEAREVDEVPRDAVGDDLESQRSKADEEDEILEDVSSKGEEMVAAQLAREQVNPLKAEVPQTQPTTGPQARHEVVERLIETMVVDGKLGEDASGRKVMMMDIQCPGRGNVRVRLWKKDEGIELRIRADNPELKSLIMMGRSELQASAKERGVVFSKIEVA